MKFNNSYFICFSLLLLIECGIAYFLKTGFVRHTLGDFLVVIMLYCFFKSFTNKSPVIIATIALFIAFTIEFLQLTPLLQWLDLEGNSFAKTVLGSTFHVSDLWAYTLGILTILLVEYGLKKINSQLYQ